METVDCSRYRTIKHVNTINFTSKDNLDKILKLLKRGIRIMYVIMDTN